MSGRKKKPQQKGRKILILEDNHAKSIAKEFQ
jgi:hypothetical protein